VAFFVKSKAKEKIRKKLIKKLDSRIRMGKTAATGQGSQAAFPGKPLGVRDASIIFIPPKHLSGNYLYDTLPTSRGAIPFQHLTS
jgi:hypothetical protein